MTYEIDPSDIGNLKIDAPEKAVQIRMVNDVKALAKKGMTEEQAVDWVFSNKQCYIDNPEFSSINN